MTSAYILILAILILGGIIAAVGDRIGTKVGKARLRLFNLRPKQTAVVFTVITGIIVSASTLGILFGLSKSLRQGVFQLDEILKIRRRVKAELEEARKQKQLVEDELEQAQLRQEEARNQILKTENELKQTQKQLKSISNQANKLREEVKKILDEKKALLNQQENLAKQSKELQERVKRKDQELSLKEQEIDTQDQILLSRENELKTLTQKQNNLLKEQQTLVQEREKLIEEKNTILKEQQALVKEKNTLLEEKKTLVEDRKILLEEKQQLQSEINNRDEKIKELDEGIAAKNKEVIERENKLLSLGEKLNFVQKQVEFLAQYYQNYQELRERPIALLKGQVLALALVKIGENQDLDQAIDTLLRQANRTAIEALGYGNSNQRIVQITTNQVEQIKEELKSQNEYLLRIISAGNYVKGEREVRVFADLSRNQKIYNEREIIASVSIDPDTIKKQELQGRLDFLLSVAEFRARRAGFLGKMIIADGKILSLLNFVQQLQNSQQDIKEIRAITSNTTYTSGPLQISLIVINEDGQEILRL